MSNRLHSYDVCIVGGGPAACALAIALRLIGHTVIVIDRSSACDAARGESLPPSAKPVLDALGVSDDLANSGHLPCFGNEAAWGTSDLVNGDFVFHPLGSGWQIDRKQFDVGLMRRASALDADSVRFAGDIRISRHVEYFLVAFNVGVQRRTVRARFIADCTGRAAWVVRRLSVARRIEDRLVALVMILQKERYACDAVERRTNVIESSMEGWWYTAAFTDRLRVVTYHSDSDMPTFRAARESDGFFRLLRDTRHVGRMCNGYIPTIGKPRVRRAGTEWSQQVSGDSWLAVGDAALSYDPLSSQGVLRALQSGVAASIAIDSSLRGDGMRLRKYDQSFNDTRAAYLTARAQYYGRETRWGKTPFWIRRHETSSK